MFNRPTTHEIPDSPPHRTAQRSAPDNNIYNNYSTKPNINPYTGQTGTVNPYSQPAPSYGYQQPETPCYYNCPN